MTLYSGQARLLISPPGSAESQVFPDASSDDRTITANGNVQWSDDIALFGDNVIKFDGSGDYLTTPFVIADFPWWTGCLISAWVYADAWSTWGYSANSPAMIGNCSPTAITNNFSFGPRSDGKLGLYYYNGSAKAVATTETIPTSTLTHIAMTVVDGVIRLFIGGVKGYGGPVVGTPQSSASFPLVVGQYCNRCITGYVGDLLYGDDGSMWVDDFTPPPSPWTFDQVLVIRSGLGIKWSHILSAGLDAIWKDAELLRKSLNIYWSGSRLLSSGIIQEWNDSLFLQSGLFQQWRVFGVISAALNQRWTVLQGKIYSGIGQIWDVKNTTPLSSAINQFWTVEHGGAISVDIIFSIEIGGIVISSVTGCNAGLNNAEAFNTAEVRIASRAEFGAISLGHHVVIIQFGVEFKYFVSGKDSGWALQSVDSNGVAKYSEEFVIRCESYTAALHTPYAATINREWIAGGSASQIITELASIENITVDFQTDDFLVPAGYLKAEKETPWEIIQKITGPLRLTEQTLPDGTLVIRDSFPDRVGAWGDTQPFYLLSADGGFNRYTEQFNDDQPIYNMVTVHDSSDTTTENLIIEAEDISANEKRIKVWEVPWRGDFKLDHSGDSSVSVIKNGIVAEKITETIEIVDGLGSVSKPCYAINSFYFKSNNLTGVTYREDGEIKTDKYGNTLIDIEYTTKYAVFVVRKGMYEKLQIFINGVEV